MYQAKECPICQCIIPKTRLDHHMEEAHHEPQLRDGETYDEMIARFIKANPEARYCFHCCKQNRPWAIGVRPSRRFSKNKPLNEVD